MHNAIRLQVEEPCHQNWDRMQTADTGRYCGSCCKTVVDFTAMSDAEVLGYLMKWKADNICGRFNENQLYRPMQMGDAISGGGLGAGSRIEGARIFGARIWMGGAGIFGVRIWMAWGVVAALLTTRVQAQQRQEPLKLLKTLHYQTPAFRDTASVPKADSFKTLEPCIVRAAVMGKIRYVTGAVSTVSECDLGKTEDESWRMRADLASANANGWTAAIQCSPNPARRGTTFSINWRVPVGFYRVNLFNTAGALVAQRELQVAGVGQVDSWVLPAGLAAGVYVLRAQGATAKDVFVQKMEVL